MSGRKILIADDEPHVSRVLRLMLERAGYDVEVANDGLEALERLATFHAEVLISDIQMPRMDGRGLCRAARANFPDRDFTILVMTSMTAMDERLWVRELRDTDFLEKPVSPRQLVARLAEHFAAKDAAAGPPAGEPPDPTDPHFAPERPHA